MANECIPFYRPGQDITGHATAAVTGKRCVKVSGNRSADGNIAVAHADAGGRIFGAAAHDAAQGAKVGVISGGVVPIEAGGVIAAFAEVEVGAAGRVVTLADGFAIGYVVDGAADGDDAQVFLYQGGYLDTDTV